jgi:hypothetical protein
VSSSGNGSGWVVVIVALSIFVPVVIASILTWWFLTRGKASDPDAERLKQVQADYERRQRESQRPS